METEFSSNNSVQPIQLFDELRIKFYLDSYIALISDSSTYELGLNQFILLIQHSVYKKHKYSNTKKNEPQKSCIIVFAFFLLLFLVCFIPWHNEKGKRRKSTLLIQSSLMKFSPVRSYVVLGRKSIKIFLNFGKKRYYALILGSIAKRS